MNWNLIFGLQGSLILKEEDAKYRKKFFSNFWKEFKMMAVLTTTWMIPLACREVFPPFPELESAWIVPLLLSDTEDFPWSKLPISFIPSLRILICKARSHVLTFFPIYMQWE